MLEILSKFDLSIFAILSLSALLYSIYYKEEIYSYSNRLLKAIILNTILITLIEILAWSFDGTSGDVGYILNYGFNFILIILAPGIPGFWASYVDYKINGDKERVRKRLLYMHGLLIGTILMFINFFTPIMFSIDSNNVYSRGPALWVNFIVIYILLFYSVLLVLRNRNKIKSNLILIVVGFLFISSIAAYFQMINYGLVIMWPATAIAIIVAYLFLETKSSEKDYLTGLYNRSRLSDYAKRLVEKSTDFTIIMMDLDDYKKINDTHGHYTGDKLIVIFSNIIKSIFNKDALVSRYGGDEFMIVVLDTDPVILKEYKQQITNAIKEYDDELVQSITFSYGYSSRTKINNKQFEKLITEADDLMYQDKAINKNYKRRKSDL